MRIYLSTMNCVSTVSPQERNYKVSGGQLPSCHHTQLGSHGSGEGRGEMEEESGGTLQFEGRI